MLAAKTDEHEPAVPYILKIGFGLLELGLLVILLEVGGWHGRGRRRKAGPEASGTTPAAWGSVAIGR